MNRLIKFRGKVNGVWWYATPDQPWWSTFWTLVDRNTLGQYITNDKRDREVYDGDIVTLSGKSGEVRWNTSKPEFYVYGPAGVDWSLHSDWEVIGNRVDNPELLSKEGAA